LQKHGILPQLSTCPGGVGAAYDNRNGNYYKVHPGGPPQVHIDKKYLL